METLEPYTDDEISKISDYADDATFNISKTKKGWYIRPLKILYLSFTLFICPILTILLVYGKNIVQSINCTSDFTIHSCIYSTLDVGFSIFFILIYYQAHIFNEMGCCQVPKYHIFKCNELTHMKHKTYVTIFVMYLISNNLIILAHVFGWLILKYYFDLDEFFTYKTSLMGCFSYLGLVLLFIFIYWTVRVIIVIQTCIKDYKRVQQTEKTHLNKVSKGRLDLDELIDSNI